MNLWFVTWFHIWKAISPAMSPEELLSSQSLLVELFPILGDVQHAYELNQAKPTMMVVGTHGVLIAGEGALACESGVLRYLQFMNCSLFLTSFHRKVLGLEASLREIRSQLGKEQRNDELRQKLSQTSMDYLKVIIRLN